jgi:hypothetical protein
MTSVAGFLNTNRSSVALWSTYPIKLNEPVGIVFPENVAVVIVYNLKSPLDVVIVLVPLYVPEGNVASLIRTNMDSYFSKSAVS